MKILKKISTVLLLSCAVACPADAAKVVDEYGRDGLTSDMALIYAGASHRPDWTKEQLLPYVTHEYADGRRTWFFDSFLFMEFAAGNVAFGNGYNKVGLKSDWEWLLGEMFADGYKLHALDELIGDMKKTLGEPPMRHKVVISCCAPCKKDGKWQDIGWGELDGENIDFSKRSHRLKAVKWYVDRIVESFENAAFENIDLIGVYWVEESLWSNSDIIASLNSYIRTKGLKSYWIPYYPNNEQYKFEWSNTYHFDMAYQQPNYFFCNNNNPDDLPPYSQLEQACIDSKKYGLGLELEFETSGSSNGLNEYSPAFHQRLVDYLNVFDEQGVFEESCVAYYTGTKGIIDMAESSDPVNHATMDRIAATVEKRHAAISAGIDDVVADVRIPFAYAGRGEIFITAAAPDACVYTMDGVRVHSGAGRFACAAGAYVVSDGHGETVKLIVK